MCEQTPVGQLVGDLVAAEDAGFDFSVMSDHYFPWLEEQGHSGYAWSVLGAAAQATRQAAADDVRDLPDLPVSPGGHRAEGSHDGRPVWGTLHPGHRRRRESQRACHRGRLAAVTGTAPAPDRGREDHPGLFAGDYVNFSGQHFAVERAKLFDLPETPVPIGIAVSGAHSLAIAGRHADCMIATEPEKSLTDGFSQAGGSGKPRYGQLALCYDTDEKAARARARRLWRWAAPGWHVMSELPEPRSFDAASEHVTEDDIATLVPCGPDIDQHVTAARQWIDAGFTHLALVQVGSDHQAEFMTWAADHLLPALRKL